MINIFPEFESRQVLTSDELNWMGCYLDLQNRETRRLLIGCGLIGGLQLKFSANKIILSNGCGITSAGHIAILNHPDSFTTFSKLRKYEISQKDKLSFHYLSSQNPNEENYSNSVDKASVYFPEFKNDIYELLEDTVNAPDEIKKELVIDKVAVLFVEILQKELKDCEADNCQEKGKKYIFNSKVLLFKREDALSLLQYQFEMKSANELQLKRLAFPWLYLPNINILKPVLASSNLVDGFNNHIILKTYEKCLDDLLDNLNSQDALIDDSLFLLKKQIIVGVSHNDRPIKLFIELLNKIKELAFKQVYWMQHCYDFALKFVQAYQELQMEAQSLRSLFLIREAAFPNHLFLGTLDEELNDFDYQISTKDILFRHRFYPSPVQSSQSQQCKKVAIYLERLNAMVNSFNFEFIQDDHELKITPGGNQFGLLSLQAIPYYLNRNMVAHWSIFSNQQILNDYITSYHLTNQQGSNLVNSRYANHANSMYADQQFFRIEGLYKKDATSAMSKVFEVRKEKGLPFEVLMLRLNEKAPFNHQFNLSINEDLLSLYQVVRAELLKQIQICTNYFGAQKILIDVFDGLKNEISKSLEASYLTFIGDINKGLIAKLNVDIENAVIASNITQNNRLINISSDVKYNELNSKMQVLKSTKMTSFSENKILVEKVKGKSWLDGFVQTNIDFPIFVLFQNTLGVLVSSIRNDDKFKKSTDISFYTHLYNVADNLYRATKDKTLFYATLKLYCALQLQVEYLVDDFLELEMKEFDANLNSKLFVSSMNVLDELKSINSVDAIFEEVEKENVIHYTERIQFDDDWVKIKQIDIENQKRNGGLGVENLLGRFVSLHPGISHGHGVPPGGTFIMVYNEVNEVMADFYLPYLISSHLRPIQFTLLENKSLTLSGKVSNADGQPVFATLEIGNTSVFTDKEGFYNALIANSTKILVTCISNGFEKFEKEIDIKNQSEILNIVLKSKLSKQKKTLIFCNEQKERLAVNIELLDIASGKNIIAKEGVMVLEDEVNSKFEFRIVDEKFVNENFIVMIDNVDSEEKIICIGLDFLKVKITDNNLGKFNSSLLKSIKLKSNEANLILKEEESGLFISEIKLPLNQSFVVMVIYDGNKISKECKPDKLTELVIEKTVENSLKEIKTFVLMTYPTNQTRFITKVDLQLINRTKIQIDHDTNLGVDFVLTNGKIVVGKPLMNAPEFEIKNTAELNSLICIIDASLILDNVNIEENKLLFHFTKAYTGEQLKFISKNLPSFKILLENVNFKLENAFCIIASKNDINDLKELLLL